jgi:hypothetical protein
VFFGFSVSDTALNRNGTVKSFASHGGYAILQIDFDPPDATYSVPQFKDLGESGEPDPRGRKGRAPSQTPPKLAKFNQQMKFSQVASTIALV